MSCLHPISLQLECQFKRLLSIDFLLLLRGKIIIYFWNAHKFDLSYRPVNCLDFEKPIKYLRLQSIFEREN